MAYRSIRTTTSSAQALGNPSSRPGERTPLRGFDASLWDAYAPFFDLEEGAVFPVDQRELDFYSSLRSSLGGRCLEIGAGCGRLARSLCGGGLSAGLEPSSGMLDRWTPQAREAMHRVRGLGQEPPFRPGVFDLVVFPYNGLHCLLDPEERASLCREAGELIAPGGWLVLETCPAFCRRPLEEDRERYRQEAGGACVRLVESVRRDSQLETITFDMRYLVDEAPAARLLLVLALIDCRGLLALLDACGLSPVHVWGDYDRSPYDEELSPRLLVAASRKEAR